MNLAARCFNCLVTLAILCAAANADVVVSEPPDFGLTFGGPASGTLELGENTISGNLSFNNSSGDLIDVVAITLPDGLVVEFFELSISNFEGLPDATFIGSNTWLQGSGFIDGMLISGNGSVQFPTESLPDLTPGTYDFQQFITGSFITANADWQLNITTAAAIPEPSSLMLLGLGAMLSLRRRMRCATIDA